MYLFIKIYGITGQLSRSSFMELVIFFRFCNFFFCIYRVIYLTDLYAGFITTKITKLTNLIIKNILFCSLEITYIITLYYLKIFFFTFTSNLDKFQRKYFSNYNFSCFEWKYCDLSQNIIYMSFIYLRTLFHLQVFFLFFF